MESLAATQWRGLHCIQPQHRDLALGCGHLQSAHSLSAKVGRRWRGVVTRGSMAGPTEHRQMNRLYATPSHASVSDTLQADAISVVSRELEGASPLEIMDRALSMYGRDVAIAFSGAEDVALIEYAHLTGRPFRVFSLDTGRLNPETYSLFNEVEKRYNIRIEYYFPNAAEVEDLVRMKGLFSFYEDGHQECCAIRKVRPLKRALRGLKAWITGQRKDQSPTRAAVPVVQVDGAFEGLDGGPGSLVKWNPLANTKGSDVWRFLRLMDVPVNSLHARGYVSIGCEPCTRAILPGQHEREGRWWWEDATAKECGLHKSPSSSEEGSAEQSGKVGGHRVASRDLFVDDSLRVLLREDMENLLHQRPLQSTLIVLYAPWCPFCQAMEESFLDLAKHLAGSSIQVAKFNADGEQKIFAQQRLGMKSYPTIVFFSKAGSSFTKYNSEQRDKKSLLSFVDALK